MTLIKLIEDINDQYIDSDINTKANIITILEEALAKIIKEKEKGTHKDLNDMLKDSLVLKTFTPYLLAYRFYLDSVK